jgi:hypothetical protein
VVFIEIGSHVCRLCAEFTQRHFPVLDSLFFAAGRARHRYVDYSAAGIPRRIAGVLECGSRPRGDIAEVRAWFYDLQALSFEDLVDAAAERSGVSQHDVLRCADSVIMSTRYVRELRAAADLEVPGTPTFIIGEESREGRVIGWAVVGPTPLDSLVRLLADADSITGG